MFSTSRIELMELFKSVNKQQMTQIREAGRG